LEWHELIVTAYVIVLYAARNQWRQERFQELYLPSTREHPQEVSVLFADLAGFTTFVERSSPAEVAAMLAEYYGLATPLINGGFGGEVEKFIGDAIMATFTTRHVPQAPHSSFNAAWRSSRLTIRSGQGFASE